MKTTISVLLVDDHAVVREGYRRLLEQRSDIRVVGEAGNAAEACQRFAELAPDVVVMDIGLPGVSGIEAMRRMLAREPAARVLVFSMHDDGVYVARALQAGALGYVSKASAPDVLVDAVHSVARGARYLSRDVAQGLALQSPAADESPLKTLSAREFEVLRLLLQGMALADIGVKLGLTTKTVANHQSAVRHKLGAESGAQLVHIAQRLGVIAAPRPA